MLLLKQIPKLFARTETYKYINVRVNRYSSWSCCCSCCDATVQLREQKDMQITCYAELSTNDSSVGEMLLVTIGSSR